jgi:hypothetical protein
MAPPSRPRVEPGTSVDGYHERYRERPERVHRYLSDRYQRLAVHHNSRGRSRRAARLWTKARWHFRLGGGGDLGPHPPAGALAMPIPEPPTFTRAIGFAARRGGSDDAA